MLQLKAFSRNKVVWLYSCVHIVSFSSLVEILKVTIGYEEWQLQIPRNFLFSVK